MALPTPPLEKDFAPSEMHPLKKKTKQNTGAAIGWVLIVWLMAMKW